MPSATFLVELFTGFFWLLGSLRISPLLLSFTFSLVIIKYFYYFLPAVSGGMITRQPPCRVKCVLCDFYEGSSFTWVTRCSHRNSGARAKPRNQTPGHKIPNYFGFTVLPNTVAFSGAYSRAFRLSRWLCGPEAAPRPHRASPAPAADRLTGHTHTPAREPTGRPLAGGRWPRPAAPAPSLRRPLPPNGRYQPHAPLGGSRQARNPSAAHTQAGGAEGMTTPAPAARDSFSTPGDGPSGCVSAGRSAQRSYPLHPTRLGGPAAKHLGGPSWERAAPPRPGGRFLIRRPRP